MHYRITCCFIPLKKPILFAFYFHSVIHVFRAPQSPSFETIEQIQSGI